MSWVPWPFDREYMQLALVAAVVIGVCAPLIGTFLVQKRQSLLGDGIGHVAFAGVALGLLVGVWPIWTALMLTKRFAWIFPDAVTSCWRSRFLTPSAATLTASLFLK